MFNQVDYRKVPGFGWLVVGQRTARKLGLTQYATPTAMCAKGHISPMSVRNGKCVKCLAIFARNKKVEMTNDEAFMFWRKKLKLPRVISVSNPRYVYVVENMPYPRIKDAVEMTGLAESVIYYRCKQDGYPDYQKIPTNNRQGQQYSYQCGKNEYNTIYQAVAGEDITAAVLLDRFNDKKLSDWKKLRIY